MLNKNLRVNLLLWLFFAVMMISCADQGTPSSQGEYQAASPRSSSDLIMPPGLTAPNIESTYRMLYSESVPNSYQMNKIVDMSIVAAGSEKWLLIKDKSVNQVFPWVKSFLNSQNIHLEYCNLNIGLIQTDWIDQNNVTKQGAMHEFLGWIGLVKDEKPLPSLYNFRVNLWQSGNDTQMFVTDYQANETVGINGKSLTWVSIPPNPQLELDFLLQFMAFVKFGPGVEEPLNATSHVQQVVHVKDVARDKLADDKTLILYDDFAEAWWRASIALERVGLGVARKNRELGELDVYPLQEQVVNKDPGSFKRLLGDDNTNLAVPKPKYKVKLVAVGSYTKLTIELYPGAVDKDFALTQKRYLHELETQLK